MASLKKDGLTVTAHLGDSSVLLAFDIDDSKKDNLAGFSIECTTPSKGPYDSKKYFLKNSLSFDKITSDKKPTPKPSDIAPFQTFHWIHFPSAGPGNYQYTVYASYFANNTTELRQKVTIPVDLSYKAFSRLEMGFTRGYVSSQAYADRFKNNKNILPKNKSIDFDTSKNRIVYEWLGTHARKLVFDFLQECENDKSILLDVFAYDLDEPAIIQKLIKLAPRIRIFQDDYTSTKKEKDGTTTKVGHGLADAIEMKAVTALKKAGAQTKTGHFGRFAHNKIMIQKKNGKAVKALTGSANFSMRGLYVQANSVLVFDDPFVAGIYEQAFEQAFTCASKFRTSFIASKWHEIKNRPGLPLFSVSFAPHKKPFNSKEKSTLDKVDKAINSAQKSVLFAIMSTSSSGQIISSLENLKNKNNVFSLGTTQQKGSHFKLSRPGMDDNSAVVHFDYLKNDIAPPFKAEWGGGQGQVIHHKFVVCDFNGKNPTVFCGSSNLAEGGETCNGDNLIAIYDKKIATYYAVEAIRLFDHYRFRNLHENSTTKNPLTLKSTDEWINPYYDDNDIKSLERQSLIV